VLYLNVLNQPEQAFKLLQHSYEIDPYYDWTNGLLGDYYSRFVSNQPNIQPDEEQDALVQATEYYSQALKRSADAQLQLVYSYAVGLGSSLTQLGKTAEAITAYEKALQISPDSPDRWRIEMILSRLYSQIGDTAKALEYAQSAMSLAPEDQKENIKSLIAQLGGQP
jgi:tetratricopeptide (TPR) repeat protein